MMIWIFTVKRKVLISEHSLSEQNTFVTMACVTVRFGNAWSSA